MFQYLTFLIISIMIVLNVRGFLANLLFSLKNILKDHSIKLSYNAIVLIFSFVSYWDNNYLDHGNLLLMHLVSIEHEFA